MRAALDLTKQKFGKLRVIERVKTEKYIKGGLWRCQCECGQFEILQSWRIPHTEYTKSRRDVLYACRQCSYKKQCAVCKKDFLSSHGQATCSPECLLEQRRKNYRAHYYRLVASDPELNKKRSTQRRERARIDPEYAKKLKSHERKRIEKHKTMLKIDPEYRGVVNARARVKYSKNSKEIQKRKRALLQARINAMTPAQYDDWCKRMTLYARLYARQWRDDVRKNPEKHQRYLERMRDARYQWESRKALKKLSSIATELEKRVKK